MSYTPPNPLSTDTAEALYDFLVFYLYDSPTSLIPSDEKVQGWLDALKARPDASDPKIKQLIDMCGDYISPSSIGSAILI